MSKTEKNAGNDIFAAKNIFYWAFTIYPKHKTEGQVL